MAPPIAAPPNDDDDSTRSNNDTADNPDEPNLLEDFEVAVWTAVQDGERNFLTHREMAEILRSAATDLDGRDVLLSYDEEGSVEVEV